MKYARIVNGRTLDVVDTAVYNPRPEWGQTDKALLDKIFEAVGGSVSFIAVPDFVEPGAYVNDDGTYENSIDRELRQLAEDKAAVKAAQAAAAEAAQAANLVAAGDLSMTVAASEDQVVKE